MKNAYVALWGGGVWKIGAIEDKEYISGDCVTINNCLWKVAKKQSYYLDGKMHSISKNKIIVTLNE